MSWFSGDCRVTRSQLVNLSLFSAVMLVLSCLALAQQPKQKTFVSAEEASQALFSAAQADDHAAMLEIFGPKGNEIISSGDLVQDKNTLDQFVAEYKEMHRVSPEPDGTTTLFVGANNWPLPVPLVRADGVWHFDAETGQRDILLRRIGQNEFATTDVCNALVSAQAEYYSQPRDGKPQQYAQVFVSNEGQHNGLFWKAADGEPQSPIGPLVAYAAGLGYMPQQGDEHSPFHGYYYRILTSQAQSAQGGSMSYIVNGAMTGGFAILAYPAEYRSSGVVTFIVNQTGVIYQKDLGPKTTEVASGMTDYAPDKSWTKVE